MGRRRIELSATQVMASLLAAITGAVAASYLGVAGTVIGVAVMSLAGTAGAEVLKHYLGRSREQLREAASRMAPRAGGSAAAAVIGRRNEAKRTGRSRLRGASPTAGWPDRVETEPIPAFGGVAHQAQYNGRADGGRAGRGRADGGRAGGGRADGGRADGGRAGGGRAGGGRADGGRAGGGRRRRPLMIAGVSAAVFVVVMGGITAFEASEGKPLDALFWGRPNSGTTVSSIVGGPGVPHTSHPKTQVTSPPPSRRPNPTTSASASTSPSPTPTPSSSGSASATPTPTPTPTPTSSGPAARPR